MNLYEYDLRESYITAPSDFEEEMLYRSFLKTELEHQTTLNELCMPRMFKVNASLVQKSKSTFDPSKSKIVDMEVCFSAPSSRRNMHGYFAGSPCRSANCKLQAAIWRPH
jgi:hypothetical protein